VANDHLNVANGYASKNSIFRSFYLNYTLKNQNIEKQMAQDAKFVNKLDILIHI
jgi:hypothetical protein